MTPTTHLEHAAAVIRRRHIEPARPRYRRVRFPTLTA